MPSRDFGQHDGVAQGHPSRDFRTRGQATGMVAATARARPVRLPCHHDNATVHLLDQLHVLPLSTAVA